METQSLQSYIEMDKCIYNFTKDGKCSSCGNCCSNLLPMSDREIERIRRYIKRNHIKEQKHFIPLKNQTLDLTCPFLDLNGGDKKCVIYEVRPMICKCFLCSEPKGALQYQELYKEARKPINVRSEFFG